MMHAEHPSETMGVFLMLSLQVKQNGGQKNVEVCDREGQGE